MVPWTLNPLNSAKSPWVVYMSNFRLLVHPLLIDFGEGSSSCCCCSCSCSCDRGKTKSTPSLDSRLWTGVWQLVEINVYITLFPRKARSKVTLPMIPKTMIELYTRTSGAGGGFLLSFDSNLHLCLRMLWELIKVIWLREPAWCVLLDFLLGSLC